MQEIKDVAMLFLAKTQQFLSIFHTTEIVSSGASHPKYSNDDVPKIGPRNAF